MVESWLHAMPSVWRLDLGGFFFFGKLISPLPLWYHIYMRMPYKTLKPLYKLMIDRGITWKDIRLNVKMQPEHFGRLQRGIVPRFYIIQRLMDYLECRYTDIVGWEI